MTLRSESDLLVRRLDSIQAERAAIKRKDEELGAEEQRIRLALDVIKSVLADFADVHDIGRTPAPVTATVAQRLPSPISTISVDLPPGGVASVSTQPKQRLEDVIRGVFREKDGLTSGEVVERAARVSEAKRESVVSTLSRMTSKGLVRRDGRLYFLAAKNESPEVGTSRLSIATQSVTGQHTSSAPIDEEGDLA